MTDNTDASSAAALATVNVTATNTPPVAVDDIIVATEDGQAATC